MNLFKDSVPKKGVRNGELPFVCYLPCLLLQALRKFLWSTELPFVQKRLFILSDRKTHWLMQVNEYQENKTPKFFSSFAWKKHAIIYLHFNMTTSSYLHWNCCSSLFLSFPITTQSQFVYTSTNFTGYCHLSPAISPLTSNRY